MLEQVSLDTALCLPAPDVEALLEGQLITVIPFTTLKPGWAFALYPCNALLSSLPFDQQYQSWLLPASKQAIEQIEALNFSLKAWAKCEFFQILHNVEEIDEEIDALANKTIWTKELLKELLQTRGRIFLAHLRVYYFPEPIVVKIYTDLSEKLGKFVGLPKLNLQDSFKIPLQVNKLLPVLSDETFERRRQQHETGSVGIDSGLKQLAAELTGFEQHDPRAAVFNQEVRNLLGWRIDVPSISISPIPDWIGKITATGNSSDGHAFEKLVRRSLIELGFSNSLNDPKASLDPDATGGAGGLDVYCDAPFSLVGECKASKHESVPNSVSSQLIHLGNTHLGKACLEQSIKMIFAAGALTDPAKKAAIENQINVMRPETLQKLVNLKVIYPGSINLLVLKSCLEVHPFGEDADTKVEKYIHQVVQDITLRSHVVKVVKDFLEKSKAVSADTSQLHASYLYSDPPKPLTPDQLKDILIELSSPLTGYLGRQKGEDGSDRFYYLRDLPVKLD